MKWQLLQLLGEAWFFFVSLCLLLVFTNLDVVDDAWGVGVANGGDLTYILSKVKATVSIQIHPSQRWQQQHRGQTNTPIGKRYVTPSKDKDTDTYLYR